MMREKPDVLVCVDYPGFNMKLAKVAHDLGIPVVLLYCPYYMGLASQSRQGYCQDGDQSGVHISFLKRRRIVNSA